MKISDYITAEDWNALGAEKQHHCRPVFVSLGIECLSVFHRALFGEAML